MYDEKEDAQTVKISIQECSDSQDWNGKGIKTVDYSIGR